MKERCDADDVRLDSMLEAISDAGARDEAKRRVAILKDNRRNLVAQRTGLPIWSDQRKRLESEISDLDDALYGLEKNLSRGVYADAATVRGMVDAVAGESGRMHRDDAAFRKWSVVLEKKSSGAKKTVRVSSDNKDDAGRFSQESLGDGEAGKWKIDSIVKSDNGEGGDARAASLAQGGTPNIAVARAIEAVKKDSIIGGPEMPVASTPIAQVLDTVAVRAAGMLFVTPSNQGLFIKRGGAGDHTGEWCFPAGHVEGDESAEAAALREAAEEVGQVPDGPVMPWTRQSTAEQTPDGPRVVDFTTFLQRIDGPFEVTLNDESVGHAWAPVDQPPEPLHPGCRVALAKLGMDELGLARAIAAGELTSPQRYQNVWLFALRITGTGYAYRSALNEFTYRRPEHYLTDDYLARCNGLAVILMHPKKATLDSKEFSDRVVGAMMLPYIDHPKSEVWGIARIYDDEAAAMMLDKTKPLSTSPTVVLRKTDNTKMKLEDGSTLIIEGKPTLMDHLAICENGVWDKGEGPKGIRAETITEELAMADADEKKVEDKKADETKIEKVEAKKDADDKKDEKKSDADAGTQLDKVLAKMDAMNAKYDAMATRMDAFEKKPDAADDKKDEKSEKKDDAEKDDKKDEKDEKKADSVEIAARADANKVLADKIDALSKRIPKGMNDDEYHAMADAQARADNVFTAFGKRAPRPLDGENLAGYRRRLARDLKSHSRVWKDVNVEAFADDAFTVAENQIYADAEVAAAHPVDLPQGHLRGVTKPDTTGRQITSFYGEPKAWMQSFGGVPRRLTRINNGSARRDH